MFSNFFDVMFNRLGINQVLFEVSSLANHKPGVFDLLHLKEGTATRDEKKKNDCFNAYFNNSLP